MASVTRLDAFDSGKLQFTTYRKSMQGSGGTVQHVYGSHPLRIQTSVGVRLPFGLSTYPNSDPPKKSIDFDLGGQDDFRAVIEEVEGAAKAYAVANGAELFGITDPDELKALCRLNFRSSIKKGKEGYSDTFKAGVDSNSREDKIKVFVGDFTTSALGTVADVKPRTTATAVLELRSLWVVDGKFGCKWSVPQIKVYSQATHLSEAAIAIDDGSTMVDGPPPAKRLCVAPPQDTCDSDDLEPPPDEY